MATITTPIPSATPLSSVAQQSNMAFPLRLQSPVIAVPDTIQGCQAQIRILLEKVGKLKSEKGSLELLLAQKNSTSQVKEDQALFAAQLQIKSLNEQIGKLQVERQTLESKCSVLERERDEARSQRKTAEKTVDTMKDQLGTAKRNAELGKAKLNSSVQTTTTLTTALANNAVVDLQIQRMSIAAHLNKCIAILQRMDTSANITLGGTFTGALGGFLWAGPLGALVGAIGANLTVSFARSDDFAIPFIRIYAQLLVAQEIAKKANIPWPPVTTEAETLKTMVRGIEGNIIYPLRPEVKALLGIANESDLPFLNAHYRMWAEKDPTFKAFR